MTQRANRAQPETEYEKTAGREKAPGGGGNSGKAAGLAA